MPLTRTISLHTGTRHETFRHAVRARDRRCVVTGKRALLAYKNGWTGFEAAHIFPLVYQGYWNDPNFSRWITTIPTAGGPINSVQNGLLFRSDIHQLFDSYFFSINPDVCKQYAIYFEAISANNCSRITTRLYILSLMQIIWRAPIWIKNF